MTDRPTPAQVIAETLSELRPGFNVPKVTEDVVAELRIHGYRIVHESEGLYVELSGIEPTPDPYRLAREKRAALGSNLPPPQPGTHESDLRVRCPYKVGTDGTDPRDPDGSVHCRQYFRGRDWSRANRSQTT